MTNDARSPEDIERHIEKERAGLTDTLDDLQQKLSFETIARQVADQFTEHGGDIGRSVTDAVKRNPIALALTGAGLAWLMMGNGSDAYRRDADDRRYGRAERRPDRRPYARFDDDDDRSSRSRRDLDDSEFSSGSIGSGLDQPMAATPSSYTTQRSSGRAMPSWASSSNGDRYKARGASVSGSDPDDGSSMMEKARDAGGAMADKAKGVAGVVSDTAHSMSESVGDIYGSASDRTTAFRERLAEGTEHLTDDARERVIAAREKAMEARDATMAYARQGRDKAADIFEDQPLIAGALALAIGAAIGSALPRSKVEDDYLGDQSDHLMDEAERIFAVEKEKMTKVAKAVTDEAKDIVAETRRDVNDMAPIATAKEEVTERLTAASERITDAASSEAEKQDLGQIKKT